MKEYKLIVTDIDDTLIGNDLIIHPADREALAKAARKGVVVTIATGRMFDSALPYVQALGSTGPVICCQGAAVVDSRDRQVIYHCPVPVDMAREVLQFAEEFGIYAQYYTLNRYYFARECDESRLYQRLAGVAGEAAGEPLSGQLAIEPTKILYIGGDDRIREAYRLAKDRWGSSLEIGISKPCYLEFTHPMANKGDAARRLAAHLGIGMDQVICIGDGINDLSMIRAAGLGIAMGNGAPELRAEADYVTLPLSQCGVAHAVEKFILHGEG